MSIDVIFPIGAHAPYSLWLEVHRTESGDKAGRAESAMPCFDGLHQDCALVVKW